MIGEYFNQLRYTILCEQTVKRERLRE